MANSYGFRTLSRIALGGLLVVAVFQVFVSFPVLESSLGDMGNRLSDSVEQGKKATGLLSLSHSGEGYLKLQLPILPNLRNDVGDEKANKALRTFFDTYPGTAGLIHVNELKVEQAAELRSLAHDIMGVNVLCGNPMVNGSVVVDKDTNGLEYCFWADELVSRNALKDFRFEEPEWKWVVHAFQIQAEGRDDFECLAFMDVGVNIGDWVAPIRAMLPQVPYLGVEGLPPNAAIATANMLTSIEYHRQQKTAHIAPGVMLPFPLLSWRLLRDARRDGGVCFQGPAFNLGGVAISSEPQLNCLPRFAAGGTAFPHALRHWKRNFQPSCGGKDNPWPTMFIAKFDIEGFEYKAIISALEWLQQRPPCYIMMEMTPGYTQNNAIIELLTDVGYDAMWRGWDILKARKEPEFPFMMDPSWGPGGFFQSYDSATEQWKNVSGTMQEAFDADMSLRKPNEYRNYVFGFQDHKACIDRLLSSDITV